MPYFLNGLHFVSKIFRDQVEQGCAELDDLLVRKAFTLQLAVEAFRDRLVSVEVQFFSMFVSHDQLTVLGVRKNTSRV